MTLDDDNSIYVGGLSYDVTEDSLRKYFHIFGQILATKIVNDRGVGGKCYGFVTFTNPRSATNAIDDMDGTTFNGRVIRVNEVRTRGGRSDFRENFRSSGRDADWDREKERDSFRDRGHYRDRNTERPRDHDRGRERENERGHYSDQARDHAFDRGREVESHDHEHLKDHDQNSGRDNDMDSGRDKDMDKSKDRDGGRVYNKEQLSRNKLDDRLGDRRSRELSSDSSDGYHEMEEEVARSNRERDELQKELRRILEDEAANNLKGAAYSRKRHFWISLRSLNTLSKGKLSKKMLDRIEEMVEEKKQLVSNLRKKSQKLEDSLADAKKRSSQRHIMLKKLHKCFLHARDYAGKLKTSEQELELLVDTTMEEVDATEDANTGNDSLYTNGQI